jgi:hypothetical protein
MSIENVRVVDFIGTDINDSSVTLTISDHLEWGDGNHLLLLQEKINTYLSFIESGEIFDSRPDAYGEPIRISIVCKYHPDEEALKFLQLCKGIIEKAGYGFRYEVLQT